MYYNKKLAVRSEIIQKPWGDPADYDIYQNYIDEIHHSTRFEKYYFVSPALACSFYKEHLEKIGNLYAYEIAVDMMIDYIVKDKKVNEDLDTGKTCIIFDMGCEYVPENIYKKVNKYFGKHKHSKNIKYWTMFENANWKGDIEIISASSSTCRFSEWTYDMGLKTDGPQNEPEYYYSHYSAEMPTKNPKRFLFLNRRIRDHRCLTLAELLHRKIDVRGDFHLSFLGSENAHISKELDKETLYGLWAKHEDRYEYETFDHIWNEFYGNKLPYSVSMDRDEWLAGSYLDRVTEMFPFRRKSYVEIITEFTYKDDGLVSISEKLSQAILSKKPFIIVGDKNYLKVLKDLGFKTFNSRWSEKYDKLKGRERILSIVDTIEQIQKETPIEVDELNNIVYDEEMQSILDYNYTHYKVIAKKTYERIFCSLSCTGEYKKPLGLTVPEVKWIQNDDPDNQMKKLWDNGFWYSENTNTGLVPIWKNASTFILNEVAPKLGYRLVSHREAIDSGIDVGEIKMIAVYRDPIKRLWSGLITVSELWDSTPEELLQKLMSGDEGLSKEIHLKLQTYFIENYNVKYVIDLDDPHDDGKYRKFDWGKNFGERQIVRNLVELLTETKDDTWKHRRTGVAEVSQDYRRLFYKESTQQWIREYYDADFQYYFQNASWRFRRPTNRLSIGDDFKKYLTTFNETYHKEIKDIQKSKQSVYFESSLRTDYWNNHMNIMNNIGLTYAPKHINILDMGTHFGFIPHFLKSRGFTNVHCTNSFGEAGDNLKELKNIWKLLDINPIDLHISPSEWFNIPNKYDVIFISMSNIFWRANKIVRLHGGVVDQNWQVEDNEGVMNTFFTPYEYNEILYFLNNLQDHLTPGGIAVIQPYPFVYDKFKNFEQESNLIKFFQHPDVGHETPLASEHNPDPSITNYFIIQKNVNIDPEGPKE